MANKVKKLKKKQPAPLKKETNALGLKPWPDLPQQLIKVISWQYSTLRFGMSYGGVTKSWRSAQTKQCCNPGAITQPWLELHDANEDTKFKFNISFHQGEWTWGTWYWRRRPWQMPWKYYVGCSNGVLVAKRASSSPPEYYLHFVTIGECCQQLPPWDQRVPFQRAVISSSHKDPDFRNSEMIVLTGISHPAFVYYKQKAGLWGGYEWIKEDGAVADPHCYDLTSKRNFFMRFTNAIGYKGKFYALSLQGTLAVIEDARITALGTKRAAPTVHSRHFKECLLESDGEILLVFLISKKSVNIVDDVEVFRLDIGTLSWIKMERLGDRTLFRGSDCCMSVSASKVGCRSDCIYFRNHIDEDWCAYDFQKGISQCESDAILPQDLPFRLNDELQRKK